MIEVPVRVKDALREGNRLKRYNFYVLNDDGSVDFTLSNSSLVYESVKFDERMCSGDVLKFGLCEGTSLEFQYYHTQNIRGREIRAEIQVQYTNEYDALAWYTIPMGYFTVKQCSKQASTGIQKVTAYNKLQSDYLDTRANDLLIDAFLNQDDYTPSTLEKILNMTLEDYKIDAGIRVARSTHYGNTASDLKYQTIQIYYWQGDPPDPSGDPPVVDPHYLHIVYGTAYIYTNSYSGTGSTTPYKIRFEKPVIEAFLNYEDYYVSMPAGQNDVSMNEWLSMPAESVTDYKGGQVRCDYYNTSSVAKTYYQNLGDYTIYDNDGFGSFDTPYFYRYQAATSPYYLYEIKVPVIAYMDDDPDPAQPTSQEIYDYCNFAKGIVQDMTVKMYKQPSSAAGDITVTADVLLWPNVTLRELQGAVFELECQYGKLDRETDMFSGVELNQSALYPADSLYPADNLYPGGVSETNNKSWYSKLWTDAASISKFRNLIITYQTLDENNQTVTQELTQVVNANGNVDYIMDNNWLFKNLVWSTADVTAYAQAMATKMQNILWIPFEMWAAGLPYLETGDMIEILGSINFKSYVLQRQLSGIQNLQDTYINGTLDIF